MENLVLSVSDFIALTNQTLEVACPSVNIEGEVASFKVNQGKFVFFDLKDSESTVGCFMMVFQLRVPIEDGMKVIIKGSPKLTKWGKFSLTVAEIRPSGEGALKKSFELLREKLDKDGLFSEERKRRLPTMPGRAGVISSVDAAGYADFIKILNDRWSGIDVEVAHVQVQGAAAPDQIMRALTFFNQSEVLPDVIVIIRGGGSADDLSIFNDEPLVRAVAASRIPTLTGIGHEVDTSLVDLAADVAASTPSNAAQLLVPDKSDILQHVQRSVSLLLTRTDVACSQLFKESADMRERISQELDARIGDIERDIKRHMAVIEAFHPQRILERGYAIMRGEARKGGTIEIETAKRLLSAEVQSVKEK